MSDKYKAQGAKKLSQVPLGIPAKKTSAKTAAKNPIDYPKKIEQLQKTADERLQMINHLNEQIDSQKKDRSALEKQITEMKQFLADYGFQWVGGPAPAFGSFPNGPIDMTVFMQRVDDLNKLADSNQHFSDTKGIKTFQHAKVMQLVLKNNGFTINNGPLRPYTENNNGMFFQDIMDGYFPGEFKKEYPDGIKFSVDDQRSLDLFSGTPRRLLESSRSSRSEKDTDDQLGEGDGKLKVKFPDGSECIVNTLGNQKVRQIRRIIVNNFQIDDDFELCSPPSNSFLNDNHTLASLNLYPRGIVLITINKK